MNEQVLEEIKRLSEKVTVLNNGWCHFEYEHVHFVSIPDKRQEMIRISVPHIANGNDYSREILDTVINETNQQVKFIKAILLNNGSLTLDYDHQVCQGEKMDKIVSHMITTLYAASEYIKMKFQKEYKR
ncbi:MAG: hypothetical protein KBT06_07135 [Prevotellaceae bacterium]|nr:hypothetical protein [Candidatus Colivivens equi]